MNFGYGTLAKMSVEEVDGEIVVAMKDNQYIGPMPKPTDAWNRYFRATHVEGEDLYTVSALAGIFENGVITLNMDLDSKQFIHLQAHLVASLP